MELIEKINQIQTIEELEELEIGHLYVEISHRGGGIGFGSSDLAVFIGIDEHLLPNMVGAYTNYLGGGIRGAITGSDYSKSIPVDKKELLDAIIDACKRVYKNTEDEMALNDEEDEEGETNWDAIASNNARKAGIVSAY